MIYFVPFFWVCYGSLLGLLSLYGLHRYWILYLYYRYYKWAPALESPVVTGAWPRVTVQLPIYNEAYVVERLIHAVAALDYPKELLEIQVLDDSTDATQDMAARFVEQYRASGLGIHHLHRTNRQGFKAGALQAGLKAASGEFIAIFDADFMPEKDFLKQTVPYFQNNSIGMVQTRWGHVNRNYSLLTRLQALFLDGHFILEHTARNRSNSFFNFNGTAGVWRKRAITDAGGWHHDTLTEDLDLSYRAQLAGWKFLYLPEIVCPAELPVDITAFKNQQHRWTKGAFQTAKKILPLLWRADVPFKVKLEGTIHLTSNVAYVLAVLATLLMLPSLAWRYALTGIAIDWIELGAFVYSMTAITLFYAISQREAYPDWKRRMGYLPALLSLGMGICFNNARAVLEAIFNKRTDFHRTPKLAIVKRHDRWKHKRYRNSRDILVFLELALFFYSLLVLFKAWQWSSWGSLPFALLFLAGYGYVTFLSLLHTWPRKYGTS